MASKKPTKDPGSASFAHSYSVEEALEIGNLVLSQIERATQLALEQSKQNTAFAKHQLDTSLTAHDPTQALQQLQSQLAQSARHAAGVAAAAFELSQGFQAELASLAMDQASKQQDQVQAMVADAMTHAPEEQKKVVSAIQEVIEAGNAAVAHSAQTAQQSMEMAQQYFHQLSAQANKKRV